MELSALESFLIERGAISSNDVAQLHRVRAETSEPPVSALRRTSVLAGQELARALADFYSIPLAADEDWPSTPVLGEALSRTFLRENKVLPLAEGPSEVLLAVADPGDTAVIEAVRLAVGKPLVLRLAAAEDIDAAIERLMANGLEAVEATPPPEVDDDVEHLKDLALGAPVVRLVNELLLDAVHARATDIHIEPFRGRLVVRMRIDGMLRKFRQPPAQLSRAIVSRIKILSGLNIAERRLPQDGRARIRIDSRQLDLRVATMPTISGEAVAIRLLDNVQRVLDLAKLGFSEPDEAILRRHLTAPYGLILVTGPTGSGKTTTLATALTLLNEPHRKILTIEDPIEYQIDGINQTQAKPDIGIGFANALRAFLRHDPDVIMVGEIRDSETARIAVHAALTGHLVLSTLHTNSAPGAITRLLDMDVDGYLLASSLRCVVGQRLVRVLCKSCREQYRGAPSLPAQLVVQAGLSPGEPITLWRAKGCDHCAGTGYAGRIAIAEVLDVGEQIQHLIRPDIAASEIARAALEGGMTSMAVDGLRKCQIGWTTSEEVRRVALEV